MGTYADMRTATEVLRDAIVKHRVLRGIALLEEKYGPDWASRIDLDSFDLGSSSFCVLGQLYDGAEVTDEQAAEYGCSAYGSAEFRGDVTPDDLEDGYSRGLAILDGDLVADRTAPAKYGFLEDYYIEIAALKAMNDDGLVDLGATREMVDAAYAELTYEGETLNASFGDLQELWAEEIAKRQQR